MPLKLCGFSVSNYYNKLKIQLLENGVSFEEELVWVNPVDPDTYRRSPMGKSPFFGDASRLPVGVGCVCRIH